MNSLALLLFSIFLSNTCFASEDTSYYSGTEVHTSLFGKPQSRSDLLVIKKVAPEKNQMIEVACSKKATEAAQIFPIYMKIQNNRVSEISDTPKYTSKVLTGKGVLEGPAWSWNYLVFSITYKMNDGVSRIEDENWIVGDHLIAIKEVFWKGNGGSPEMMVEVINVKTKSIKKSSFDAKWKSLGCPIPPVI